MKIEQVYYGNEVRVKGKLKLCIRQVISQIAGNGKENCLHQDHIQPVEETRRFCYTAGQSDEMGKIGLILGRMVITQTGHGEKAEHL